VQDFKFVTKGILYKFVNVVYLAFVFNSSIFLVDLVPEHFTAVPKQLWRRH